MKEQFYNDPVGGTPSSVGPQIRTDHYYRKALLDIVKEQYFSQLADTVSMPKNYGKTIKRLHYIPILDDRNINDQGLDTSGVNTAYEVTLIVTMANGDLKYFVGSGADQATASAAALDKVINWANSATLVGGLGLTLVLSGGGVPSTRAQVDVAVVAEVPVTSTNFATAYPTAVPAFGNLYGSSKNIGDVSGKFPSLRENGGRVNRVGLTRKTLQGSISKYGFFGEYTRDSLDFDTDTELEYHITSESLKAANEIYEDQLQIDLLNGVGVSRYTGVATSAGTLQGNSGTPDVLTYDDLVKLSIVLDKNRCPKQTKIITGSRMIDTKVINASRYMYIGSELLPMLKAMKDYHNNPAFTPVSQYANAANIAHGEVGTIDQFRFIVVPEMMRWEGAGAVVGTNGGYHETNGKYDVFPMLVVGDESFTTIGFQTDGKSTKFQVMHKKPKDNVRPEDPFGETGFYSIRWFFGTLIIRPERLAVIKTIASF